MALMDFAYPGEGALGTSNAANLAVETAARVAADTVETIARTAADTAESTARAAADAAESTARSAADAAEIVARTAAITTAVAAEATILAAADTAEIAARSAADAALIGGVASIAALRLVTTGTLPQTRCLVAAYTAGTTVGGGSFWVNAADTTTADNGGTIIVDTSGRRWYRLDGVALRLEWFGGGTAVGSNVAAFNAAIAVGASILFGPGTYSFAGAISYAMPSSTASCALLGAGAERTLLAFPAGGGITLNLLGPNNSFHVRDFSILGGAANCGSALTINQNNASITNPAETQLSDVTNVTIRGSDGLAQTDYWTNGVVINRASSVNFTNLFCTGPSGQLGVGVVLQGTAAVIPVLFNLVGCVFNNLNVGLLYGAYVQGVTVSQCNFTFDNFGVLIQAAMVNLAQLLVTGCQFNCTTAGIFTTSNPPGLMITNNFFIPQASSNCIVLTSVGLCTVTGNTFFGLGVTGAVGINIVSSSAFAVITGNAFVVMVVAINLQAGSSNVNVQSNSYQACGTNVANAGTANVIGGGSA